MAFDGTMQICREWVHMVSLGVFSKPGDQELLGSAHDPIRVVMLKVRAKFGRQDGQVGSGSRM